MSPRSDSIFRSRQLDGHEVLGLGAGIKSYALLELATQQSSPAAAEHVQFETIVEQSVNADISVSAGAGQLAGLITLPAGKVFFLEATLGVLFDTAGGILDTQWRDNTGAALLGSMMRSQPASTAGDLSTGSELTGGFAPAGALEVELRILLATQVNRIDRNAVRGSQVRIFEV